MLRRRFFKNNSINVKVVADPSPENESSEGERNIFEGADVAAAYAEVIKDVVTHTALTVGGVWAAVLIIRRICK